MRSFNWGIRCLWAFVSCLLLTGCDSRAPIDAIVVGDSMIPSLWGDHCDGCCKECSAQLRVGSIVLHRKMVKCPHCGSPLDFESFGIVVNSPLVIMAGNADLSRFEVIAFQEQDEPEIRKVKRIVGLPGEFVFIDGGNLFINGKLHRKSQKEFREMSQLSFDSNYAPASSFASDRTPNRSNWQKRGSVWHFKGNENQTQPSVLTLEYSRFGETTPACIRDDFGVNESTTRKLNPMDEASYQILVAASPQAHFSFEIKSNNEWIIVQIDLKSHSISISGNEFNETVLFENNSQTDTNGLHEMKLECVIFDGAIELVMDDQSLYQGVIDFDARAIPESPFFRAVGLEGEVRIDRIQIFRDVFWFQDGKSNNEFATAKFPGVQVPEDCFILLGDNQPISSDSRHWATPFVHRSNIIGRVHLAD
ncbi:MAG: S26 family signal peptidase [Pirellulaceae bacterium]